MLAARTATWWAARQLSAARAAPAPASGKHLQQVAVAAAAHGDGDGDGLPVEQRLPPELLPLVRGAWLYKLPSGAGAALDGADSGPCSLAGCLGGGGGSAQGGGKGVGGLGLPGGRPRFFQLSHDGACLRWSWERWVLLHHVAHLECWCGAGWLCGCGVGGGSACTLECELGHSLALPGAAWGCRLAGPPGPTTAALCPACPPARSEEGLTITLRLLLEPDLRLRCPSPRVYREWRQVGGARIIDCASSPAVPQPLARTASAHPL